MPEFLSQDLVQNILRNFMFYDFLGFNNKFKDIAEIYARISILYFPVRILSKIRSLE